MGGGQIRSMGEAGGRRSEEGGGGDKGALQGGAQWPRRGNELIETPREEPNMDGAVECQERLGGVLKYYRRAA